MKKIAGSRVIVINALRKKKHYSHFNLQEAISILERLKPEHGYLTHISHQMGRHEDMQKEFPSFIRLAYDGLKVQNLVSTYFSPPESHSSTVSEDSSDQHPSLQYHSPQNVIPGHNTKLRQAHHSS